jgi:2-polyprenyl-3-methyl-5-hydroxy-6-metoxy-1,4-benzoquinol methylase
MKTSEKDEIYKDYYSTVFNKIHNPNTNDYEIYRRIFKKNYLSHFPKDRNIRILDIGCGLGHFLYFLETEGYLNYIGIDMSEENIRYCKQHGFSVEKADVFTFLNQKNSSFDVILMNDVLEHFSKPEIIEILKKIHTCLNEQGMIIIKVPNAANPILASHSRYIDFTHELLFTETSIFQVLAIAGFRKINVYPNDIYIFALNPFNYIAKFVATLIHISIRMLFLLHGSKSTKIFTKHIIAVARKD